MSIADIRQGDLVERNGNGVWKTVADVSSTEITIWEHVHTESPNGAPVLIPFCFPINEVTGHIRAVDIPNATGQNSQTGSVAEKAPRIVNPDDTHKKEGN